MKYKKDSYLKANQFEKFIVRALGIKYEYCLSNMRNLIDAEEGIIYSFLPSKEKQLQKIKKDMRRAFKYYSSFNLTAEKKEMMQDCISKFEFARDSTTLLEIINEMLIVSC